MRGRPPHTSKSPSRTVRALFDYVDYLGIHQSDIAIRIGVGSPQLSLWRSGARIPSIQSVEKLAAAIGLCLRVSQ